MSVNAPPRKSRRHFTQCLGGLAASAALPFATAARAQTPSQPETNGRWAHKTAEVRGLKMHYVEQGKGPLVVLCHGFPESWFSWRHQIPALAAAGYRVVAPDLRGYGGTGGSKAVADYTMPSLVADLTGLLDALGEKTCALVGHDFGAGLAWTAALLAPERIKALAALSVPYTPRGGDAPPTARMKRAVGDNFFYILYFQQPGVAERELEADIPRFLRANYFSASAEGMADPSQLALRPAPGYLDSLVDPKGRLPKWLTEAELRQCAEPFTRHGLTGPLNWYRNIDRNWELLKPFDGARVTHPTLFIAGEQDPMLLTNRASVQGLAANVPGLQRTALLPNCGHWTQQERPAEVNSELVAFLKKVLG